MKLVCILGICGFSLAAAACDGGIDASDVGADAADDSAVDADAGDADDGADGLEAERDVCGFEGDTALAEPDAEGFRDVPPTHPGLWYAGRIDCLNADGPALGFPGSLIRVRFSGTALQLRLQDHGLGSATATNFYDVSVDGAEPSVLAVSPATEVYGLATGLTAGEHEVVLGKRVEKLPGGSVNAGKGVILGFRLQGDELLQAKGPQRRLEFVGDSITCGYGNEISTTEPDLAHFTSANENARKAYGAVTAQLLGAEYSAVAYSGKGMSRNYAGGAGETVPEFYLDTIPDDPGELAWDPAQYIPDAVIINVGTNDFSTEGVDRDLFVEKYTTFLATLRGYYPDAAIVCAIGPMLSDYYPVGAKAWTNAQADVHAAVDARVGAGDGNVHFLAFAPQTAPYGEDWHPTAATHQAMAEQLSTLLKEKLGWD